MSFSNVIVQQRFQQRAFVPLALPPSRTVSAIQLCGWHAAAVSIPVVLLLFGASPWWTLGVGGGVVALVYSYIGYHESKRQEFWLTPISFYFWWYVIGYGLSAIYAATQAYDPGFLPLVTQVIPADDLASGYTITLVGAVSLHLGYCAVRAIRARNADFRQSFPQRSDFRLWIFHFVLGLLALSKPNWFSSIGAARTILQFGTYGVLLSFCSLSREFFGLSKVLYRIFFTVGNLLLIIVAFVGGSKFMAMLSLLPIFSAILVTPKLKKSLPLLMVASVAIYLFIVAPIITITRMSQTGESQVQKIRSAAGETVGVFAEDLEFAIYEQVERFLYRQFESTSAGYIVGDVRDRGLRNGQTMQNLTYAFIPRILWPEKPAVTRGNWFTSYLGAAASEEESTTSTGIYSAAELYWNFGVPGVLIGMALIGGLLAWVLSMIGEGPHRLVIPMIIFVNLPMRIVDQASASEVIVILIYLVVFTFVYRYFSPPTSGVEIQK